MQRDAALLGLAVRPALHAGERLATRVGLAADDAADRRLIDAGSDRALLLGQVQSLQEAFEPVPGCHERTMHVSMLSVNAEAAEILDCLHSGIGHTLGNVADRMSKIRDFLIFQVSQRRSLQKGPRRLPNTSAIAKLIGVDQSTISRVLRLRRNTVRASDRSRALADYQPSAELVSGMQKAFGFADEGELWRAIYESPPAPLNRPAGARRRPRRHQ